MHVDTLRKEHVVVRIIALNWWRGIRRRLVHLGEDSLIAVGPVGLLAGVPCVKRFLTIPLAPATAKIFIAIISGARPPQEGAAWARRGIVAVSALEVGGVDCDIVVSINCRRREVEIYTVGGALSAKMTCNLGSSQLIGETYLVFTVVPCGRPTLLHTVGIVHLLAVIIIHNLVPSVVHSDIDTGHYKSSRRLDLA